jgi:hypothetical protein
MFLLPGDYDVDLPPTRGKRPQVSLNPEKQKLGHVAEVETNPASVRPPVLADLVPHDVGFVGESPSLHHLKGFK